MFEAMLKLVCRSYVQILAALYFLSFFWEGAQTMRKSMKHAHLDGIQRTKTLVQDKYGWYKPTAQRQQKTVLSKDIEAQNAKTIGKTKKQEKPTNPNADHDHDKKKAVTQNSISQILSFSRQNRPTHVQARQRGKRLAAKK